MALSGIAAKSHPVIPPPVIHHSASQSLPWSGSCISEFGQIPVLAAQVADGFPQSFKLEVPEYRILHGTPDAFRTGRTVSNSLFRRCLSSCFSRACSRSRKSAPPFGADTCCPRYVITTETLLHGLSAFDGKVHTRAAGTASNTEDLHGRFPSSRVVIAPYEAREGLRPTGGWTSPESCEFRLSP